jgi:hypothetical protein
MGVALKEPYTPKAITSQSIPKYKRGRRFSRVRNLFPEFSQPYLSLRIGRSAPVATWRQRSSRADKPPRV